MAGKIRVLYTFLWVLLKHLFLLISTLRLGESD